MTWLLVALGAAAGGVVRLLLGRLLDTPGRWPTGTLAVNVAGSALIGGLVHAGLGGGTYALLGTGFCGGLTTFSAYAVQAVGLGPRRGPAYAVLTLLLCPPAAALGFVVAG